MTARSRLIDVLLRAGVRLGRDASGALVTTPAPPELAPLIDELRTDLAAAVHGAKPVRVVSEAGNVTKRSYRWRRCHLCGAEAVTATDRSCFAGQPGCKGKLLAYADSAALTLPGGVEVTCERQGCDRPASRLTAAHEALCDSDFLHLALAIAHHERTPTP